MSSRREIERKPVPTIGKQALSSTREIITVPTPKARSNDLSYVAVVASSAVALTLFIILFRDPLLNSGGPLSNFKSSVYTFFTTVSATLLTGFIGGQLQMLWVRDVDTNLEVATATTQLDTLDSKWRTAMKVAHLRERFKNIWIETSYIIAALITSCFVAGVSPSLESRVVPYNATIPTGNEYWCAMSMTPQEFANGDGNQSTSVGTYAWPYTKIQRGSVAQEIFVVRVGTGCPLNGATSVPSMINSINPDQFAYSDMGVAVTNSSIGVPASIYGWTPGRDDTILNLTWTHRSSLQLTTQCVPVMVDNPISCRRGGTVKLSHNNMSVTSVDGSCTFWDSFGASGIDPSIDSAMVKGMCPGANVGERTIVFGASNDYISELAGTVGDFNTSGDPWYAVTCSVNTTNVYQYQVVALVFYTGPSVSGGDADISLGKFLIGTWEPCLNPGISSMIGYPLIGLAAAANAANLLQFTGGTGYFEAIANAALNLSIPGQIYPRYPVWAFNSSRNALEDVLGLTSAIVASRLYSGVENMTSIPSWARIQITRAGSGSKLGIFYVFPPAIVAILIYSKLEKLKLKESRWKSFHLGDLIGFGKVLENGYEPEQNL